MIDHPELAYMAVGFVAGFIIMSALVNVRPFLHLALCAAAIAIAWTLYTGSIPAIIHYTEIVTENIRAYPMFANGFLLGKSAAGLIKIKSRRRKRSRM